MQQNKVGEQKYFRLFGRFSLILLCVTGSLFAESFENFKRNEMNSFKNYKDKNDAEFQKYLKAQWKEYVSKYSKPLYKKKKPRKITPTIQQKFKSVGPTISIKLPKEKKIKKVDSKKIESKKDIDFLFFGENLGFNIDKHYKNARFYPQNQTGLLNFFNTLAHSDYDNTLLDLNNIKKDLKLNDWALYLLVSELAKQIYRYKDEQYIFTWFILNKLHYNVKIGLSGKHIILMHYSKKIIYATPSYTFNKKKFYLIANYAKEFKQKVYTYKQNYPEATKALDLSLKELPTFHNNIQSKLLSFKQYGKTYKISYKYNKNLIDFMATYPQADYETYFNAPISDMAYEVLAKDIKKYVDTKKASIAINFILSFVQKAFKYEVDGEQFGREKVMFADETLYYQKSDCEDRAILFSRLVKTLFGTTVIGVKYSDHMATALYIPLKGDTVKAGGRRFVIADPTYVNANIGEAMPKYKSKIPDSFIVLNGE